MKQINNPSELRKHILNCVAKENVSIGNDAKGNFIQVSNIETFSLNDLKGKKDIGKGKQFKIYEKGSIGFANGKEKLKTIKSENSEISEQIKLPEKENVMIETLISDINENIRQCKMYIQQMDTAALANNETAFKDAQSKLKKEVHSLDANAMQLAVHNKESNLYVASMTLVHVNNLITEFERELQKNIIIQEHQQKHTNSLRENPYALHLKAMMEIKENLGNDELRGTIGNVNGIVQKTGFGNQTKVAMDSANRHQQEEGATAVRDDVTGPKYDTTYENVDVDDILENGDTNFSPSFYGVAINEQDSDDRLPNREERTLF